MGRIIRDKRFWLVACGLIYTMMCINSALKGGDFDVYLDAAVKLSEGKNIYAPPFIKGLQYFYSPLFAVLLVPFTGNFFVTEFIWLLLSGVMIYRTFGLIQKYLNFSQFSKKEFRWFVIITTFFTLRFLLYNIAMIQITIFLLWAIFESIDLIKRDKFIIGSLLLAFAINVKLLPLVILPYLLYRGYFKATGLVVGFSVIFLYLPVLFLGTDFNSFLLHEWWQVINPTKKEHLIEAGAGSQNLVGLIPVFITETQGDLNVQRNFLNLSVETAIQITSLVRLALIALTLYFLKWPFKRDVSNLNELRSLSYICLLIPLIFPHQQKYAFIFLYPMIMYLSYYCFLLYKHQWNRQSKIYTFSLLTIGFILSPFIGSDIVGKMNYDLIHHFRLLGIVALLLIVYSMISKPDSFAGLTATNEVDQ